MKLTVLGASGGTGREVVRQALAAGHEVTAVVRKGARSLAAVAGADPGGGASGGKGRSAEGSSHRGGQGGGRGRLTVMTVEDLTNPAALGPVVKGRDALLFCPGLPGGGRPTGRLGAAAHALVRAARAAGVRRLLVVSTAPVGPLPPDEGVLGRAVSPVLRTVFKDVYAEAAAMESELAHSGLDWTVLRPGKLTNRRGKGRYRRRVGGNVPGTGTLARADLARAVLDLMDDPAVRGRTVGLGSARG